jgi:phosphoribosyl-ATP pyrophosphohydrolase/phosphoribosyl-AMP cyclohydrolase/histidinol dehydrogenase
VTRRPGHAKPAFIQQQKEAAAASTSSQAVPTKTAPPKSNGAHQADGRIVPPTHSLAGISAQDRAALLKRPLIATDEMTVKVKPILQAVWVSIWPTFFSFTQANLWAFYRRTKGDDALRAYVQTLDRCTAANDTAWPLVLQAPFPEELRRIDDATKAAIDQAYANIHLFHQRQVRPFPTLSKVAFVNR